MSNTLQILAIACSLLTIAAQAFVLRELHKLRKQGPSISIPDASSVSIAVRGRTIPVRHVDADGNVLHVGVGTIEESYGASGKEES